METTKNLSFPSDVLKFININAHLYDKPKVLLKVMQICKYFRPPDFPYFVMKNLDFGPEFWNYIALDNRKREYSNKFDNNKMTSKLLWIIKEFKIRTITPLELSSFLSKIHFCNIKILDLFESNISFDQFKFITACGDVDKITLTETKILNEDGKYISFQDFFKYVPKLKMLFISTGDNQLNFPILSSEAMPFLPNLQHFDCRKLTRNFDVFSFSTFFLKNNHVKYDFFFNSSLSFDDIKLFETEREKLKATWPPGNILPQFEYANHLQAGDETTGN